MVTPAGRNPEPADTTNVRKLDTSKIKKPPRGEYSKKEKIAAAFLDEIKQNDELMNKIRRTKGLLDAIKNNPEKCIPKILASCTNEEEVVVVNPQENIEAKKAEVEELKVNSENGQRPEQGI